MAIDKHKPKLYKDSQFFEINETILNTPNPENYIEYKRKKFTYDNPLETQNILGEKSRGTLLELTLKLPNFPKGKEYPKVYVVGTPENNAITMGRFYLCKKGNPHFQIARQHTGVPAQLDMRVAMEQAAQVKDIRDRFKDPAYIVYLTREGQLVAWQEAIYKSIGKTIPTTVAHIEHAKSNNKYGRVAKICPINFEGFEKDTKTIVATDNIASGLQQVALIENVMETMPGNKIEEFISVAPLLTLHSVAVISLWAAKYTKLKTSFITSGTLLGCNPPEYYYSPVPTNENAKKLMANSEIAKILSITGRSTHSKLCVRCNWTASFLAPNTAIVDSETELKERYKSSNNSVLKDTKKITPELLKKHKIDIMNLLPYSTIIDTINKNKTENIKIWKRL